MVGQPAGQRSVGWLVGGLVNLLAILLAIKFESLRVEESLGQPFGGLETQTEFRL